jgi:recombination protein RecA
MTSELDALGASILKSVGSAFETHNQTVTLFDTGFPPLNKIISGRYDGGIPSGRIVEIYGPSQSGKTHLATEIMKSVQSLGGAAIFLDHERRFVPDFAERRGLVLSAPSFFWLRPWTWEESNAKALEIARALRFSKGFPESAPIVAVLDSVASANPRSKVGDKPDSADNKKAAMMEFNMSDTTALARAASTTLPVMAGFCDQLDLTMIYLNQVREKPGVVYGDNTTTPGGKALHFYSDIRIQLSRSMTKAKSDAKEVIGQTVKAKAIKALTAPFKTTSWTLSYGDDGDTIFDKPASLIEHMIAVGLIETPKQGFVEFKGKSYRKAALIEAIRAMPDGYDTLLTMLKAHQG